MKVIAYMFTVLAMLAAVAAVGIFLFMMAGAQSAPQEASGAAIALFIVVAPYCLARLLGQLVMLSRDEG